MVVFCELPLVAGVGSASEVDAVGAEETVLLFGAVAVAEVVAVAVAVAAVVAVAVAAVVAVAVADAVALALFGGRRGIIFWKK